MKETESTPQGMKRSESLSSLIYPRWWKEMEPKTETRPAGRFRTTVATTAKPYKGRIERSLPLEVARGRTADLEKGFNIS